MDMALVSSNAQSVSISFRVLLDESKLLFPISQHSGCCFAMKTSQLFVLSVACLATVTNIVNMLLCFPLIVKIAENGCWLDQRVIKSKLQTFRSLLPPNRSGSLRSLCPPSFILMSMLIQEHLQAHCQMSTIHLILCPCSPSLRFLFVMVVLDPSLLAFLFDALSVRICLPFPSFIRFPDSVLIRLILS
ncbi:hypothetical protein LINGRAHAP2_LOCUS32195 [Linum grandiflorum]